MSDDRSMQIRSMEGLLRAAIEMSSSPTSSPPSNSSSRPMNEEDRLFLENVLNSAEYDIVRTLKKAVAIVKESGDDEEAIEHHKAALNQIMEMVEDLDIAGDFQKIGGYEILLPGLRSQHKEIRSLTSQLIAVLMQNNAHCQNAAANYSDLVPTLLKLADEDKCNIVRSDAMSALSSYMRNNEQAQKVFADNDGYSVLMRGIKSHIAKVNSRTAFLLFSLCKERKEHKDILCKMGFVEQLVNLIETDSHPPDLHIPEHFLRALCALVNGHESSIKECKRPELQLYAILMRRLEISKGKEECQEEQEFCAQLMDECFSEHNKSLGATASAAS